MEQDKWLHVLECCISSNPTAPDRSEVAISLYQSLAFIPGLLADAKSFMQCSSPDDNQRKSLLRRAHETRNRLLQWNRRWGTRVFRAAEDGTGEQRILPGQEGEDGKMLDLLCIFEAFCIDCNRLCMALDDYQEESLEQESLAMARAMMVGQPMGQGDVIEGVAHGVHGNAIQTPIIIACLGVALITVDTEKEWGVAVKRRKPVAGDERGTIVDACMYLSWLERIGFGVQGQGQ